jgi:Ca2+/Na+ antiporter
VLVYGVLFGQKGYAHSLEGLELVLGGLLGAAVLAVCAVIGVVVLIARRTHRSVVSYVAVVFAMTVCGLVFVPTGLLTTVPSATKPPSAEMLTTTPKALQK